MLNKKAFIIIFLTLHLTFSLKSIDYCIRKEKACKGFYDEKGKYKTKCESTKCHGTHNFECKLQICSINKMKCNEYNKELSKFFKLIVDLKSSANPNFAAKNIKEIDKNSFNNDIKDCQKKIYEFKSTDFCLNGQNCKETKEEIKGFGFTYRRFVTTVEIECKCPAEKSFKCGQYCTTGSMACEYQKSSVKPSVTKIKDCGNHDLITYKSMLPF